MLTQPKAPDPYATAAAQGTINKQTAISQQLLNSMDQTTPDGSLTYSENGTWSDGTPKIGVTQSLSPTNQYLYDTNQGTQVNLANIGKQQSGQIGSLLATPFDMSQRAIDGQTAGMPSLPQYRPATGMYGTTGDPFWDTSHQQLANVVAQAGNVGPAAPNARYTDASGYQTTAPGQVQSRYAPDPTQVGLRQIGSNDQLEGELYDAAFSRFQPQLDQQRQSMEADLANRGLKPGSTGYDNAVQGFDNSVNDLRSQTFLNGQQQAFGQSAARAQNDFGQDLASNNQFFTQRDTKNQHDFAQDLQGQGQAFQQEIAANGQNFQQALGANAQNYGQDMTSAQYAQGRDAMLFSNYGAALNASNGAQNAAFTQGLSGNQFDVAQDQANYGYGMSARQQALNELLTQRQTPMNEISSLMGGSQVSRPTWTATPQATMQAPNLAGLVQSNYQTQMQGYNGMLGGLAGLGGVAAKGLFSLSDERVKQDVKQIARLPSGLGVYSYRFADGRREIGLLAQEVLMHDPSAVTIRDDGFLAVDYARALEAA